MLTVYNKINVLLIFVFRHIGAAVIGHTVSLVTKHNSCVSDSDLLGENETRFA